MIYLTRKYLVGYKHKSFLVDSTSAATKRLMEPSLHKYSSKKTCVWAPSGFSLATILAIFCRKNHSFWQDSQFCRSLLLRFFSLESSATNSTTSGPISRSATTSVLRKKMSLKLFEKKNNRRRFPSQTESGSFKNIGAGIDLSS